VTQRNGKLWQYSVVASIILLFQTRLVTLDWRCFRTKSWALLLGEIPYDPQAIRVAAQLLSGEIDVDEVLEIAKRERLGSLLHRMAGDILSFGIEHENWNKILNSTQARDFPIGVLPHRSRYVADQGNYVLEKDRYKILKPDRSVIARSFGTKQSRNLTN